jgi:hypothetical protein
MFQARAGHGAPVENPSRETIFVVSREGFLFGPSFF